MTAYEMAEKYYPRLWDDARLDALVEAGKLTAEEAMNALKVPDSDREKYFSMLKQQ